MSDTLQRVLEEVAELSRSFSERGHRLYLVGGIVRDLVLGAGIDELDFDLTTDARPPQIREAIKPLAESMWTAGERFGTIGCLISGRPYEITTHRADTYTADTRKPEVRFGDDIEIDLSRRDFTVNAMAIRLPDGESIDPFGGAADLAARRLTTPIEPDISFSDDPLRVLRAARFIARYEMTAEAALVEAARRLVDRLEIVSAERIAAELDKLLSARRPSPGIDFLETVAATPKLLPHLPVSALAAIGGQLDASPIDIHIRRAIVFAHVSRDLLTDQLSALRYSNDDGRRVRTLLAGVDYLSTADPRWTDEMVRRFVALVGLNDVDSTLAVARATGLDDSRPAGAFADLATREDLSRLEPELDGEDVMRELAIPPGRAVGDALAALRDRRLRDGPATRGEELAYLRSLQEQGD